MKRTYKTVVTIHVPESVIEEIDLLSAEEHKNRSAFITDILTNYIHAVAESRDYDYREEVMSDVP